MQNKILVISQQRDKNQKKCPVIKRKQKERKGEQKADLTSRERETRLYVKTNHINNHAEMSVL